jgi:hypothetical protein
LKTMSQPLKLYYQNVRGLWTKTNEIQQSIKASEFDIILLTETWLREGIYNHEFIDENYKVIRKDRDKYTSKKNDGGGVLIASKSYKDLK